ncbi:hypothetical protein V1478_010508 [Vespula squamosa]|uniref:Uncharacterized protein n=1 Tax=Vespula squamosa TaxID=30214 RepID=A0ABD2AHZ2_VESSQ
MNMGCLESESTSLGSTRGLSNTQMQLTSCITYVIIRVNVSHIPRLCDILTSWNIFVVNLGIKFVPQVLIQECYCCRDTSISDISILYHA